ncbi:MAG: hypothetical protein BWX54_01957 [Verrucomicrobia bacterium ADurb.Bin018]|nr:MAG: hypothetical protein BWX54_01957 [Verrucomicrobia bacterium ADurb.Bin018]
MAAISAGVVPAIHADSGDGAILFDAGAQAETDGVAGATVAEVFLAGELPEAGPPGTQREHRHDILQQDFLLGAEAATDARLDDADFLDGNIQRLRHDAPAVEGHLRGGGNDDAPGGIHLRQGDIGLDGAMLRVRSFKHFIKGEVGFFQAFFDIAKVAANASHEVFLGLVGNRNGHMGFGFVVDDGGAFGHGFIEGEDGLELFIHHFDFGQRGLGLLLGFRGHGGHAVPDKAHLGVKHEGVVGRRFRETLAGSGMRDARHVAMPQHRLHAGHFFGGGNIHGDDPRMGVWAPEHFDDQGIARHEVGHIRRLAQRQLLGIHLGDGVVDLLEIFRFFQAHNNLRGSGVISLVRG